MKLFSAAFASVAMLALSLGSVHAETVVTLSKMHLCCGACVNSVKNSVKGIEGVTVEVDSKTKTTKVTAKDDAAAQKAVDAIVGAGFHGESDSKTVTVKEDSGVAAGAVKKLELTGVHNCCGACDVAIKKALKEVAGITTATSKVKSDKLALEGDFDAKAVIAALNKHGFHAKAAK